MTAKKLSRDQCQSPAFSHRSNISLGKARVIYVNADMYQNQKAGWVLPGGKVTQDEEEAWAMAAVINKLLQ